jgi:catechol 2,3-dioxygenase-like lactoylglutathione lyase family enzyme
VPRVQLALNVADVDEGVAFYSKLFGTEPAKRRPGYANFAIDDPPLKLVLIENAEAPPGSLNHLGVEVGSTEEVAAARARLAAEDLATTTEERVHCCYALQDKVWVDGPGGEPWEIYTVLDDADADVDADADADADADTTLRAVGPSGAACCASRPDLALTPSDPAASCC